MALGAGLLAGPAVASASPTSGHAEVAACISSDMAISYHGRGAGMGHRYGVIAIKNISDHACRTGGYGGVSYVGDGDGTQIGAPADRDPGHVRSLVVQPGQRLVSPIQETVAQNYPRKLCRPAHVDGFRVYLPNETHSQYVKHPTTGCRKHKVHLLSHKPYRRPAH
ncbi:MAG: DUF4232 domain-containing protein [Nocardioides sp.]|uniref:DUF4232 domain-containing protein n=1 Tax=Nocardioides sp. TaxID=35761 RepID=UPI0039E433FE